MPPSSKFADIDFSKMPVERVTPDLSGLGQGFRCSRGEFVTYWRQGRIQREINARITQCWVLRSENSLAGYVTLIADKLDLDQPILIDEGVQYQTFPAIKIGLLAADKRAKGAGRRLVEWSIEYVASEIAPAIGVRFLTVDALYDEDMTPPYDASGFYQKFGFCFVNAEEVLPPSTPYRTMYLDLKPLIDLFDDSTSGTEDDLTV
jgi:GNAT superfamily N-acetyltransferase